MQASDNAHVVLTQCLEEFGSTFNPSHSRDRRVVQHERLQDFIELTNAKDPKHQKPPTVKSLVLYVPAWLRYYVIPSPLKYIVYAIVRAVLTAHYKWKKWAVLQGTWRELHGGAGGRTF